MRSTSSSLPHTRVALTTCLVWLLLVVLPGAPTSAHTTSTQDPDAASVSLALAAVTPSTIGPDTPFTITGTVSNTGDEPVQVSAVEATTSYAALDTRGELAAWATGDASVATGLSVGRDPFDIALAPGARSAFTIEVDGDTVSPFFGFGTLPLTLEVLGEGGTVQDRVRSYLPWYAVEQPEQPLDLSWVVPLTVPPDPDLSDPDPQTRVDAWLEAIGPGSTPRTWLDGLVDTAATFVVDPALLAPVVPQSEPDEGEPDGPDAPEGPDPSPTQGPTAPPSDSADSADDADATTEPAPGSTGAPTPAPPPVSDTGSPTGAATATPTDEPPQQTGDPAEPTLPGVEVPLSLSAVEQAQVDLETTLAGLDDDRLWWTPVADPDLAALIDIGVPPDEAAEMLDRELPPSTLLSQPLLESGRHDVAWPAWSQVGLSQARGLQVLWPDDEPLTAAVVPAPALAVPANSAAGSVEVDDGRLTMLGFDTTLAGLLSQTPPPGEAGTTVQRLLAETMAFYQQSPSTERTLVLAPPRGTSVDPGTLEALTAALADAPWVRSAPAAEALLTPARAQLTGAVLVEGEPDDPTAYPLPQPSPLSAAVLEEIEELRGTLAEVSTILTEDAALDRWVPVLDGLASTRWRLDRAAWRTPLSDVEDQVARVLDGVQVNPTTVNFLADEGLIQMTVVNTLPIPVQDLRLELEPGNGRLRVVEAPEPFAVGADSRATVQFRARAVAAGEVPVTAYLTTPTGLVVGDEQVMQVRVQPTGVWIYWVLGGAAGVVLVLGVGRALRRPSRATEAGTMDVSSDETEEGRA